MTDLLHQLFKEYPYSSEQSQTIVIGSKNVAIMLKNGNIGVCSTLGKKIEESAERILDNPDLSKYEHRIVINAWINACANYKYSISGNSDIIEAIDFSRYNHIVMVGYFGSLVKKMTDRDFKLVIFDLDHEDKPVEPIELQPKLINSCNSVILTATTLANKTYLDIINDTPNNCHVFILGPSSPLTPKVFSLRNVHGVFGSRFKAFDYDVLNTIAQGGGTRSILNHIEKVYIKRIN